MAYSPLIISFRGSWAAGKTEAANYLAWKNYGKVLSFAGPLKEMAARITPDGRIDKARDGRLLQFLGTDYYRNIDENYWTNQFLQNVRSYGDNYISMFVDDCRFVNERNLLKQQGAFDVFIYAREDLRAERQLKRDGEVDKRDASHSSEAMSDTHDTDYMIDNNDDLDTFYQKLDSVFLYCLEDWRAGRGVSSGR